MTKKLLTATTVATCIAAASSAGLAAELGAKVWKDEGRKYACAGVGDDVQNDARWNNYPLKLIFTNQDGDFLGDVSVTLMNSAGEVMVAAQCAAPWFLASLEDGRYSADVVAGGRHAKTVSFSVEGEGQTQVVVPFPSITGT